MAAGKARARLVYKDFFTSPTFFSEPYWAQVLWIGMVVFADDDGLVPADPEWLKRALLVRRSGSVRAPSTHKVEQFLSRMVHVGCLVECTQRANKDGTDGANKGCLNHYRITNFDRYQHVKKSRKRREEKRREENINDARAREGPSKGATLERLLGEFGVGLAKAQSWAGRFSGADLDAWAGWRPPENARNPKALRLHLMGLHRRPEECTPETVDEAALARAQADRVRARQEAKNGVER